MINAVLSVFLEEDDTDSGTLTPKVENPLVAGTVPLSTAFIDRMVSNTPAAPMVWP